MVLRTSTNISTQSPVLPTATLTQAADDDLKLHQSVRECVRMANLTHFTESTKSNVAPAWPTSEQNSLKKQPVPKSCLLNRQTPQSPCPYCRRRHIQKHCSSQQRACIICCLKGHKEGFCILTFPNLINRPPWSSNKNDFVSVTTFEQNQRSFEVPSVR